MESKKYSFRYRVIAREFKDELIAVGINVDKIIQKDVHDDTITFTVRAWCCNDTQTKWFDIMAKRYFQHECGWYLQEQMTEQKCKELIRITNR